MKNRTHHPNRALSQKEMEARRKKAAPYFKRGASERAIAKKLGVSPPAVHYWKAVWQSDGISGLTAGRYGHPSKLNRKEEREITKKILRGASTCGFSGDYWTLSRLTGAVASWTGVRYHDRSVWHVMKRLGFSCQRPVKRAVERDEKAIRSWISSDWPEIKRGASKTA